MAEILELGSKVSIFFSWFRVFLVHFTKVFSNQVSPPQVTEKQCFHIRIHWIHGLP